MYSLDCLGLRYNGTFMIIIKRLHQYTLKVSSGPLFSFLFFYFSKLKKAYLNFKRFPSPHYSVQFLQMPAPCTCCREHWGRDYNRGITRYHETVILHTGTGNPITGNLPAQLWQLISSRIAAEWGQKTALWGPREELGDGMPFIIRGRPLRGKCTEPDYSLADLIRQIILQSRNDPEEGKSV